MAIRKQDFYEGAALYSLAKAGTVDSIRYEAPFFVFNGLVSVLFKYSTKGRSPWGFTIMPHDNVALEARGRQMRVVVALICGSDGVAAVEAADLVRVIPDAGKSAHVACYRQHGEWYEVNGPSGRIPEKVPPSSWSRLLS